MIAGRFRLRAWVGLAVGVLLTWCPSRAAAGLMRTDLGTHPAGTFGPYNVAWGVNAAGKVVGESDTGNGNAHAFLYSGRGMSDLGAFSGSPYCFAFGVNGAGQVRWSGPFAGSPRNHAFLYTAGVMHDLGSQPDGCCGDRPRGSSAERRAP
jgi:probable HAF family extracellular repeat protein